MPYAQALKGRHSLPGQVYLVTARLRRGAPPLDLPAGRLVVAELRALHRAGAAHTLAYVVMPDHLHWLVQLGDDATVAGVVRQLKGRSALAINRRLRRDGALWQRGFHDHALRREEDLAAAARYVVRNPVRAGLVSRVGDWPLWDAVWVGNAGGGSRTRRSTCRQGFSLAHGTPHVRLKPDLQAFGRPRVGRAGGCLVRLKPDLQGTGDALAEKENPGRITPAGG